MLLRIAAPLLSVASREADQKSVVLENAPSPLYGHALPDKGSLTAPGKGSAGDADPGEGAAGLRNSLLIKSRIVSTNLLNLRIGRYATGVLLVSENFGGEVQNSGVVPYISQ